MRLKSPPTDNGVQIVVPDPSPERLQQLTESCAEASASALTACQADLLAVAAALE